MNYRELSIYQRSLTLAINIINELDKLPRKNSLDIISKQLIRSITSISANIAEGSSSSSKKEYSNYLQISLKSAIESEHWLSLLIKLKQEISGIEECQEIIRILYVLVKKSKINK